MDSQRYEASRRRMRQQVVTGLRRFSVVGLAAITALGLVGQAVRDHSVASAVLMYLPLLPVGLTAVLFDLILRGRAIPRARFGLAILGIVGKHVVRSHHDRREPNVRVEFRGSGDHLTPLERPVGGRAIP